MSPRWVLCANHTEPVKGFLGRFLRRKLMETEISGRVRNVELVKIIDWIPKVWHHLNRFLEAHSSSDVTIGRWAARQEWWVGWLRGGLARAAPYRHKSAGLCSVHVDREGDRGDSPSPRQTPDCLTHAPCCVSAPLALPKALGLISSKRWSSLGRCGNCPLSKVPTPKALL